MFHFSPLFGFIFPVWPFTMGQRQGKVGCSKESGKGQMKEMTHIHTNSEHLTGQHTSDFMREPIEQH